MEGRGWEERRYLTLRRCWVALREAAARWSSGGGPRMRCDGGDAAGRRLEQETGRG